MPATRSSLERLSQRFPGPAEHVASLYDQNQAFRDLCDVHAICVRGVKRSQASPSSALAAAYTAQQERLETEMLRWLPRSAATAIHPTGGK